MISSARIKYFLNSTVLLCCFVLLLWPVCSVNAQENEITSFHYNIDKGLPSNNVYMGLKDRHGYLWFATENGVVKYNGYSFKIFNTSKGLPSNDVWKIYEDKHGKIYVFSASNRFGYIQDDKYKDVHFPETDDKMVYPNIKEYGDSVFITYMGQEKPHAKIVIYHNDSGHVVTYKDRSLFRIVLGDNKLWFLHYGQKDEDQLYSSLPAHPEDIKRDGRLDFNASEFYSKSIFRMVKNNLIYSYTEDGKSISITDMDAKTKTTGNFEYAEKKDEYIYTMYEIEDSLLIFSNKNIYNVDDRLNVLRMDNPQQIISSSSQFSCRFKGQGLLRDEKNLWYCTNSDGIWNVRDKPMPIKWVPKLDSNGKIKLMGSGDSEGVYYWDKSKMLLYKLANGVVANKWYIPGYVRIEAITPFRNKLLLSTGKGLTYFDPATGYVSDVKMIPQYYIDCKQYDDSTFFGVTTYGFLKFQIGDKGQAHVLRRYGRHKYAGICYDKTHDLYWIYSNDDIGYYSLKEGKCFFLKPSFLLRHNIFNINSISLDDYGNIYCLCNDRLLYYNVNTGDVQELKPGMRLNNCTIAIDNNRIFITGVFGMAAMQAGPDGVQENSIKVWANINKVFYKEVYKMMLSGNVVYVNTDRGIFYVNIDDLLKTKSINPVSQNLFTLMKTTPEVQTEGNSDTLILPPGTNYIGIEAINYYGSGVPDYYYKIAGVDKEWKENKSGELHFDNLSADKYHRLECKVEDEFWESPVKTFVLYQTPYWWQRPVWKIALTIIAILMLAILVVVTALVTRYFIVKANERKRTFTELELRAVHAQINPHFIFNTLNSALYFIDRKKIDEAYAHVHKFSKLLRSYLKSAQEHYTLLAEEIDMLRNYIELQRTRFENSFDYEIMIDNKLPAKHIKIPSLLLQPLVENAINHGLFHKNGKGLLELRFLQGENNTELICVIEDDGVGRIKAKEINETNSARKESYGTKLTQQLIDVFKEYEKLDITLNYTDKAYPNSGTMVTIVIKNIKYDA